MLWTGGFERSACIAARTHKGQINSMKHHRDAGIWFARYLKDCLRKATRSAKPRRTRVAITDHYEPLSVGASLEAVLSRVAHWLDKWLRIAGDAPLDAAGQRPLYSFFHPMGEGPARSARRLRGDGAPLRRRRGASGSRRRRARHFHPESHRILPLFRDPGGRRLLHAGSLVITPGVRSVSNLGRA